MILQQVEVKEWLNSRSSCAKVNSWSGLDPERTFRKMQQARSLGLNSYGFPLTIIKLRFLSRSLKR